MVLIIVITILLIVSIGFLAFFMYAERLNKELSKKKEKRTLVAYRNKYLLIRVLTLFVVLALGSVLTGKIITEIYDDYGMIYLTNYNEYEKYISDTRFNYDNINNDYNVDKLAFDMEYAYLLDDGEIVKVDKSGNIVMSKGCDCFNIKDSIYLYKDYLVILSFKDKGVKFVIYNKDTLTINKIYEVSGRFIYTEKKNNIIHLFLYNNAKIDPFKLGFRTPIGNVVGKIDKLYVMDNTYVSLIVSHYKFNLDTQEVTQIALGLTDLYYEIDDYYYFAFNVYEKEKKENISILITYDAEKSIVRKYNVLRGNVFKNPVKEENLNVISKEGNTYYTYIFDSDLKYLDYFEATSEIELSYNNKKINIYSNNGKVYVYDECIGKVSDATIIKNKLFVNNNNSLHIIDLNTGEETELTFDVDLDSYKVIRFIEGKYIALYDGINDIIFRLDNNEYYYGNDLIYINKVVYKRVNNRYIKMGE